MLPIYYKNTESANVRNEALISDDPRTPESGAAMMREIPW